MKTNNKLKEELVKRIVGNVSLVEMIQILNAIAEKEVEEQLSSLSPEQLAELEKEVFSEDPTN